MSKIPSDVAFTPSVKSIQSRMGSRSAYAKMEQGRGWNTLINGDLRQFIAELDMFYLGTSTSEGQPYIQYRGGPTGFLKVLDASTLGWGEFGGNRQYISTGNLSENPKAFLFLIDYLNRRRVKIWGTSEIVEDDPTLNKRLGSVQYGSPVERAMVFHVHAWDLNCPQHIHPRVPLKSAQARIQQLEQEIEQLKAMQDER